MTLDPLDGWLRGDPADIVTARDDNAAAFARAIADLRPAWMADAACAGEPIEVFFVGRGQRSDEALQICARCDVREQCLDEALDDESLDYGIRGGMSVAARQQARRTQRKLETRQSDVR